MKKFWISIAVFSIFSIFFTSESSAQRGMGQRGNGGWDARSAYNRMYNPSAVETVKGEVASVDMIKPMKGMSYGIHLMLKAEKETLSVHLGPAWYFNSRNYVIKPKDKIEITGSKITYNGKPAVIAAEVKRGNEVIKLRDESGYPVWSGRRRNK